MWIKLVTSAASDLSVFGHRMLKVKFLMKRLHVYPNFLFVSRVDPVLGSNEEKFAKKLTELKHQSVFSIHQFEIVVNEIRSCVAEVGFQIKIMLPNVV